MTTLGMKSPFPLDLGCDTRNHGRSEARLATCAIRRVIWIDAMGYRDEDMATPQRLAALDAEMKRLREPFTDLFWDRVAPVWGIERAPIFDSAEPERRRAQLAALEQAHARVAEGAPASSTLAPLAAPPEGALGVLRSAAQLVNETLGAVLDWSEEALVLARRQEVESELVYRGGGVWGMRLRMGSAPVDFRLRRKPREQQGLVFLEIDTTVTPSALLSLEPEAIWQDLLEMVGLGKEIELGDPDFDPYYLVKGDPETAALFLSPEIRRAFFRLGLESTVQARVEAGMASLVVASVSEKSASLALRIAQSWHALSTPHVLVTPADEIE